MTSISSSNFCINILHGVRSSNMTSQVQSHLQFFTPQTLHDEASYFHRFPDLPIELRRKIWRHALQRERIITMRLKCEAEVEYPSERLIRGYSVIVDGYQLLSKLLRVSQESREETLAFYRVHIPCRFSGIPKEQKPTKETTTPGTLNFNPEYDFLRIRTEWFVKDTLIDFLYRLKTTYDPHHIGLLNLALDTDDLMPYTPHMIQPSELDPGHKTAFTEIIAQLHQVFFIMVIRKGRQILGWDSRFTHETTLNRSLPIVPRTPTFDRLGRDSRAITEDLKHVHAGSGWGEIMTTFWREFLEKWDVSTPQVDYQFYLAFHPDLEVHSIYNRKTAKAWLQKEDGAYRGIRMPRDLEHEEFKFERSSRELNLQKHSTNAELDKSKNENLETAVKPAFGFWLFPIASLYEEEDTKTWLNLSKKWPDLALSSLP